MLAALGLSGDLFGERLVPVGTLYDPFIARGLDSLNYACYQDARFLLVATPAGITLGPEGGAHQSINPPLIALGQPGLRHYEPAFADELAAMMEEAFRLIDDPDGESTYLRLSTRSIAQVERADDGWKADALAGGYWLREPGPSAEAAIVAMGAVMPEALAAWDELSADLPGLGLLSRHLARPAPPRLDRGAGGALERRAAQPSHVETLLSRLAPGAGLVTLCDAAPGLAVVARRGARPARRAARGRPLRPDRQPRRPLRRLPPRRRRDHRRRLPNCSSRLLNDNALLDPSAMIRRAHRPRPSRLAAELDHAREMLVDDGRRTGARTTRSSPTMAWRCRRSTSSARCSATSPMSSAPSDRARRGRADRHVRIEGQARRSAA